MKRLFSISVLFIVMFCCCISCVVSAGANNLDVENSTDNVIGTEEIVYISNEESDDLLEHIYYANGFDENDKRKDVELVINRDDASRSNVNSSKSINTESTKRYVYDRMLNSIDYFDSLQATYYFAPSTGFSYHSTYCVQQGENPKSKELIYNENGELVSSCSFDGTYVANFNGEATNVKADIKSKNSEIVDKRTRTIQESIKKDRTNNISKELMSGNNMLSNKLYVDIKENKKLDFVSLVDSEKRIKFLPEENEECYFYRNNLPQLPMSNTQYFSQAFAFGFLSDFEAWNIDRIDEILGRECFVISGEINDDYSEKINTNKFEMWIDKEMGALLSLKGYDNNGDLSIILSTSEFIVDDTINKDVFDDFSDI